LPDIRRSSIFVRASVMHSSTDWLVKEVHSQLIVVNFVTQFVFNWFSTHSQIVSLVPPERIKEEEADIRMVL